MAVTFRDDELVHRVEVLVDDEVAGFAAYRRRGDRLAINHLEIDDAFRGQGVASQLVTHMLDAARDDGLQVLPYCPYAREFIDEHRGDYLDLVPLDRRADFGWAAQTP